MINAYLMHLYMVWNFSGEGFEYDMVFDFDQTGCNIISCFTRSSGEGMFKTVSHWCNENKSTILSDCIC